MVLTLTEKIQLIMQRRGLTYTELAQLIGMSRQNLYYKLTNNKLYLSDIQHIAQALQCDFDFIFTLDETKEKI